MVASAQSAIRGTVTDFETNEPISGAKISISGTSFTSTTDADGKYEMTDIPPGDYEVITNKDGYNPKKSPNQKMKKDVDIALNIQLEKKTSRTGMVDK